MAGRTAVSKTIRVAVCGLTSSTFAGLSGQGAGKSCLCNRFIRPKRDDLHLDQTSVLNHSEFGSNIINNTHFLYWGEKSLGLEDGQDVVFQIIEHTEFVDDSSLKPFPSTKPYHKRCTQLKLQSGGKITYIEPDQLALPEQYEDVVGKFPDKFLVDGFILCVDVSSSFTDAQSPQKEIFERLLQNLLPTKKPIVVALTKYDRAKEPSVAVVNEVLAHCKKQLPVVEVSALRGVNVDMCFLVLAHLVDPKKPKTRIIPYSEAKSHLDDRIRKNEVSFQQVLDQQVKDFAAGITAACESVSTQMEFQLLRELCGTERVQQLVRGKLGYLKRERVEVWQGKYLEALPGMLAVLLPELPLTADEESCRQLLKESPKLSEFFVEAPKWRDDIEFLKVADGHVPFSMLSEDPGEEILRQHIDQVLKAAREEAACHKIHEALQNATGLTPGTNMEELFSTLGVSEEAGLVSPDRLVRLYQEKMSAVESECVQDLTELFLENIELFTTEWDVLQSVEQQLKQSERYQRLDLRPDVRKSASIKHIANLQWPDKGPYAHSPLMETLKESAPSSREVLRPPSSPGSEGLRWILDPSDQSYNLAILGRTKENALTLRSDFLNHISVSGACEVGGRKYSLQLEVFHGEELDSITTQDFAPQGAVVVATSMACIDWLEGLLARLWVPSGEDTPGYRGMPLVILALDTGIAQGEGPPVDTPLFCRAKILAHRLQCVLVADRPTVVPKRLVVSGVVPQLLAALMDTTNYCHDFLHSQLSKQEEGLNVAVFSLSGEPYGPSEFLGPLLRHQLVWYSDDSGTLFLGLTIEKQHRTCTLTFHSALNLSTVTSSVYLGCILVYSSQRPASLAVIRHMRQQLPGIPMLVVAIETEGSHSELLGEGQRLAEQWGAMFISSGQEEWDVGCTTDFFSKCWFSRFSSWDTQEMSDEVKQRIRKRRPQPLPNSREIKLRWEGLGTRLGPLPLPGRLSDSNLLSPPVRHSIAIDQNVQTSMGSEFNSRPFSPPFGSLPRSPSRGKYMQPLPDAKKEEDPTYSNPQEIALGIEQKRATLGRTKRGSFPDGLAIAAESLEDSEYALVADHRLLETLRSPSTSPPPPPVSPPSQTNGTGTEVGNDVYATVQNPPLLPRPQTPKRNGYDHLKDSVAPRGYDRLAPKDSPYAPVVQSNEAQRQEPPADQLYSVVNKPKPRIRKVPLQSPESQKPPLQPPDSDPSDRLYSVVAINKPPKLGNRRAPLQSPEPQKPPDNEPPDQLYSVVNKPKKPRVQRTPLQSPESQKPPLQPAEQPPDQLYSVVNKPKKPRVQRTPLQSPESQKPPLQPAEQPPDQLYSVVNKPPKPPTRRSSLHMPKPPPQQSEVSPDQLYSVVNKPKAPRKPPVQPPEPQDQLYSVVNKPKSRTPPPQQLEPPSQPHHKPPPVAPKPKDKPRRSPTPKGSAESADGDTTSTTPGSSPKPGRRWGSPRLWRKNRRDSDKNTPSPRGSTSPEVTRASTLPRNVVHGRDRASSEGVPGEGDGVGKGANEEELPALPERRYSTSELGLEDEAPPLPPRRYSWSDVEDNDEEVLQSDDDLDDPLATSITLSDHQAIYSSVRRLSTIRPGYGDIQAIYNVVSEVTSQGPTPPLSPVASTAQDDHSVYDTLESVMQSMPRPPQPPGQVQVQVVLPTSPTRGMSPAGMPFTARQVKLIKQQQKLLEKLQKKADKEAERRKKQEAKKGRRKGRKTRNKEPERKRYFGSALEVVAGEDGIPVFVKKCTQFLEDTGLKSEGLYRVSGKKESCMALQEMVDEDSNLDLASLGYGESAISSTLKAFFKLLPDPLISNDVAARILDVNSLQLDEQHVKLGELLNKLPRPNLCTLRFLLLHLNKVQSLHEDNRMTASNLAIVFWPTLMRPPLMDLADPSKQMGWQLVMTRLIEHPDCVPRPL